MNQSMTDTDSVREEVAGAIEQAVSGIGQAQSTDVLRVARDVVEDEDVTKYDFVTFRSEMLNRDVEAEDAEQAWAHLRDEGEIPEGDDDDHPNQPAEQDDEPPEQPDGPDDPDAPDGELRRTDDGVLAQLPEWAMEPWDVAIDPMGAGPHFGEEFPCETGGPEVLWHFAGPDEVDTLQDHEAVTGQNTRTGGMFDTQWGGRADGAIFNALAGPDLDADEGMLIGLSVCMGPDGPEGDEWTAVSDARWEREGGYTAEETVAYKVSKQRVPDDAPEVSDIISPLEQFQDQGGDVDVDLTAEWDPGQSVALTQEGCPACEQFKNDPDVSQALESGALVEVQPDHPDWNAILDLADVQATPAVLVYTGQGFQIQDGGQGGDEAAPA